MANISQNVSEGTLNILKSDVIIYGIASIFCTIVLMGSGYFLLDSKTLSTSLIIFYCVIGLCFLISITAFIISMRKYSFLQKQIFLAEEYCIKRQSDLNSEIMNNEPSAPPLSDFPLYQNSL